MIFSHRPNGVISSHGDHGVLPVRMVIKFSTVTMTVTFIIAVMRTSAVIILIIILITVIMIMITMTDGCESVGQQVWPTSDCE